MSDTLALHAFDPIERALDAFAAGGMLVVVDDEHRENEGDLIVAAEHATPECMAFLVRHGTGIVCAAMTGERLDALALPPMVRESTEGHGTAFTVSVDAKAGTTTGVSAADRSATVRALIDPATRPEDLARPGQMFPLRAREMGVLQRPGHTEAAVDLARLAGLYPAGVICEVVDDDGAMARLPRLIEFARGHGLPLISIADLIRYRVRRDPEIAEAASWIMSGGTAAG